MEDPKTSYRTKRYLTGIDWVVNAVDYASKAQSGIGNHSEIVLELENPPQLRTLQEALNRFIRKFPVLAGYPSRALNLCPYWKIPPVEQTPGLRLQIEQVDDDSQCLSSLANQVNAAFRNRGEHLVFILVHSGGKSFLGMVFDHRLLDAKGAEALLHLFQQFYRGEDHLQVSLTHPAHLNQWIEKFRAGRQLNRFLLKLTKEPLRVLPFDGRKEPCKFKVVSFNPDQSARLTAAAYASAGYLMFLPYALAKSIQIIHRSFEKKGIPGATYLIPVPMDTRSKEEARKESLFNHFSFFVFKIDSSKTGDLNALLAEIKKQMYEQVKNKIPEAIINASCLMRIASLPVTNFFLKLMSKKHFASFSFSYLNNAYQENRFMQAKVLNIFHLPRTPKPPGIGIFFNQFDNKLNVTLSYFEDLLSEEEAEQIIKSLEALGNEE